MDTIGRTPSTTVRQGRDAAVVPPLEDYAWSGLASESERIGVNLDSEAAERFARYRDLLVEWSGRVNLTAVRDPKEIERRLFLDGIAMIPTLDAVIGENAALGPLTLIDVGAGAGFPGLVLKIARPELRVTLLDATAKKIEFLNAAICELALDGVRALHGRAEELGRDAGCRERFHLATARAVASLPVLLEYVAPLLRIGGVALLPKGLRISEELRASEAAASVLGARIASAEPLAAPATRLVVVRKFAPTPAQFPRRAGLPSREPIAGQG